MALAAPHLELENVSAGALKPVSLRVEPGEIVCVSGPSGAGKSRLLRAMADLEPHSGAIWLGSDEQQSVAADLWRRWVTLVPAESQWWADSVGDHFACDMEADLEILGLEHAAMSWAVSRLSSGEKQRLALVRALCHKPRCLLLDEPTASLDPGLTLRVESWITALAHSRDLPVVWVAHDPRQIERVAGRHYRIRDNGLEPV